MLFKQEFHQRIVDDTITTTYWWWKTARVKVGNTYRLNSEGVVKVDGIRSLAMSDISEYEAQVSGFESREALIAQMTQPRTIGEDSSICRVAFHYMSPDRNPFVDVSDDVTTDELGALIQRLQKMDSRDRSGSWTAQTLTLIDANPIVASSQLAPTAGMETKTFKATVRKLKRLGLTISYETGYGLTSLGSRVLSSIVDGGLS